jgi:hypothetical protein
MKASRPRKSNVTGEGANECATTMYLLVVADSDSEREKSSLIDFYSAVPSTVDRYSETDKPGADHVRGEWSSRTGPDVIFVDGEDDGWIAKCVRDKDARYEVVATIEVGADVRGICRGCLHEAGLGLLEEDR